MPFHILHCDITKLRVDAIVNAANQTLLGGGGVDGAIHRAAGPALFDYCAALGGCQTGEAKISPGFALPANWVIHTVGPVWRGGTHNEEALLSACYRNALALALAQDCRSVAFPLISAGAYGYPKEQALAVAVREIRAFLLENEMDVILAVFDKDSFRLSDELILEVTAYLDRRLSAPPAGDQDRREAASSSTEGVHAAVFKPRKSLKRKILSSPTATREKAAEAAAMSVQSGALPLFADADSLDERLRCLDESFSEMLLRKIDEKGLTDAACYKRANVDRKHFSKIRSDPGYRPSKPTAIAFAIALELSLDETRELLMKAGFALSHSNKFDVIIEFFISAGNYNIFQINETLFAFDQALLG